MAANSARFEDYSLEQLIELRNFCADLALNSSEIEGAADVLSIIRFIDEELVLRERQRFA